MNKKTQMWLGIAAVGVAGYWFWNRSKQEKVFANLVSRKSGGGVLDTRECAGPVEVATYQAGANPTSCHWSCTSSKTGELINLGPAPCPAATF